MLSPEPRRFPPAEVPAFEELPRASVQPGPGPELARQLWGSEATGGWGGWRPATHVAEQGPPQSGLGVEAVGQEERCLSPVASLGSRDAPGRGEMGAGPPRSG
eukprot:1550269-Rhodomonas_salina.1